MAVELCQQFFLHLLIRLCGFFSYLFVNLVNYIDFWMLDQLCISGINPSWQWYIIFIYCWICLANVLLRTFVSLFIRDTGLISCTNFIRIWYQNNTGLIKWVVKWLFPILFSGSCFFFWLHSICIYRRQNKNKKQETRCWAVPSVLLAYSSTYFMHDFSLWTIGVP